MDLCAFKASLIYSSSSGTAKEGGREEEKDTVYCVRKWIEREEDIDRKMKQEQSHVVSRGKI